MTRFTRDERMLEELVHDVFVEAYFSLDGYRGDAPFEHWLQRIATRVGYRYWTRRGREPATVGRASCMSPNRRQRTISKKTWKRWPRLSNNSHRATGWY